jgi:hypothetical protein
MGEISRALGRGAPLAYQGKTYTLAPWNYDIQAEFEEHLEGKAWAAFRRSARHLSQDEVDALRAQTLRDITAGVYSFGGAVSAEALTKMPHLQHLLLLLLRKNHPEITPMLVQDMVRQGLAEVMTALNEANADPFVTPQTPAESKAV